jgi:hypothetical protein
MITFKMNIIRTNASAVISEGSEQKCTTAEDSRPS